MVGSVDPYRPVASGVASYITNLVSYLKEKDVEVTFLGVSSDGAKAGMGDKSFNFIQVARGTRISRFRFMANLMRTVPSLKLKEDTIIHVHRPDDMLPFVLHHKKNPKVCTLHGHYKYVHAYRGLAAGMTYDAIEKFVLRRTHRLIAVSDEMRDYYATRYPWTARKLCVIPVGVDTDRFRPMDKAEMRRKHGFGQEDKIIIYVGRLEKEKRLDLLMKTFHEIGTMERNAKLVLVGDGKEKERLQKLTKSLDTRNVIFKDVMRHDDVPGILNCANVFALSSRYEGLPTALLEALACGIPVVSTNVGDVSRIVKNGRNGYVVERDSELKDRLVDVLMSDEDYTKACVETAAKYSWKRVGDRIFAVYEGLMEGHRK